MIEMTEDKMANKEKANKESKIWLSISLISGIIYLGIMTTAIYDNRFEHDLFIFISVYIIMFVSFLMYALTRHISTKEVISILIKKVRG